MNDSLRTDVFLRFTPETIACACIDLSARALQVGEKNSTGQNVFIVVVYQIALPKNPPWFVIFGARRDEIDYIMISILRLYRHRPVIAKKMSLDSSCIDCSFFFAERIG